MKVPNHKHGLQTSKRYLKGLAGEVVSRGKIEEIPIGREILNEASSDGSISISDNHLRRFHFFLNLKLGFVPRMIRKIL
jgi:hypothetical protein